MLCQLPLMGSTDKARASIRIVIADDHPIFREGLIKLLETKPDLLVVGAAADGDDAMKLVAELEPELLLLDLAMPRMGGLELCKTVAAERPGIKVLTMSGALRGREQLLTSGLPFLQKPFTLAALRDSIEALLGPQSRLAMMATDQ